MIENIGPGDYSVIVTDGGGCTNSTQVTLTAPEDIVATVLVEGADCYGDDSNGQVIVETVVITSYSIHYTKLYDTT